MVNEAHERIIHTLNINKILVISSIAHHHHSWMDFLTTTWVNKQASEQEGEPIQVNKKKS